MSTAEKGTETVAYKQSILRGLANVIELHRGKFLGPKDQEMIDALEYGLTTRLNELVEECKQREVDLKIASMKEVLAILKKYE